MFSVNLNRRHKAGLFVVLVATSLSVFFEASARQTAGIVFLGVAATWLFGSVSLRVLGFRFSSLACVVGLCVAIFPILNERHSYLVASAEYDSVLVEIRAEIRAALATKEIEIEGTVFQVPADYTDEQIRAHILNLKKTKPEIFAKNGGWKNSRPLSAQEIARMPKAERQGAAQAQTGFETQWRHVRVPISAQYWFTDNPYSWRYEGGIHLIPFPAGASETAIMSAFQTKYLVPRPTFSIADAIRSHRMPFLGGVVLVGAGLLGFAGMLWTDRRSKREARVSAM